MKPSMYLLFLSFILLFSCKRNFIHLSEANNKYNLTTISQLEDKSYSQKIEYFYNRGKEETFVGKANIPIYCIMFEQKDTEKVVLISSGNIVLIPIT